MAERKRWILGGLLVLFLFGLGAVLFAVAATRSSKGGKNEINTMLRGDAIGIVTIEGVIYDAYPLVDDIMQHQDDPSIKALVIRINSPGGAVAPSQEIYEAVRAFKASGKPVIASLSSVAASGGYYVAAAADTIVTNPGTLTGSIGVIFQFPNAPELMKKIGVDFEVIKSGPYKDAGSLHRKITPQERALFQGVIDDTWEQFVGAVAEGRGMPFDSVAQYADGSVFTGRHSVEMGLCDLIGTYEDAKQLAKKLAKLPEDAPERTARPLPNLLTRLLQQPEQLLKLKNDFLGGTLSYLFKP